jgi:hypothetical protein
MFSKRIIIFQLLVCSCGLFTSACKYEPTEFESQLGITTPCVPAADYFHAIEGYLSEKISSYHSSSDHRQGKVKFMELVELIQVAREESAYCIAHDNKGFELASDQWRELQLKLSQILGVAMVYEHWEKPWEDSDIDLFQKGLEGIEIKPDYSQMPMDDCEKECDK